MKTNTDIFSGLGGTDFEDDDVATANVEDRAKTTDVKLCEEVKGRKADNKHSKCLVPDNVIHNIRDSFHYIRIIPIGKEMKPLLSKLMYKDMFDLAFVSQRALHLISNQGFNSILKKGAGIVVETEKYSFPLQTHSQQIEAGSTSKMSDLARENGWKRRVTATVDDMRDDDCVVFMKD